MTKSYPFPRARRGIWDGRKRANYATAREREPRADRRVPEGQDGPRESLAAGPRGGPGVYPGDPRGWRSDHHPRPAVLPRPHRPPRRRGLLPQPGARRRAKRRGLVHAGAGEGDPGPQARGRQGDRQGGRGLDRRQGRSHPAMKHVGVASAEDQEGSLRTSLSSDIVFIVAGLGGSAGTGAAPVVARAARANGAVTVGIAILPFEAEGRTEIARQGLEAFREEADSVVVLDNNSLDRFADQVSFNEAMQVISYMVVTIVQGVVEHLSRSYLSTLTEEIENAAREIEEANNHAVPVDVQPPETVQASWDLGPVAFDDQGFIGLR